MTMMYRSMNVLGFKLCGIKQTDYRGLLAKS